MSKDVQYIIKLNDILRKEYDKGANIFDLTDVKIGLTKSELIEFNKIINYCISKKLIVTQYVYSTETWKWTKLSVDTAKNNNITLFYI